MKNHILLSTTNHDYLYSCKHKEVIPIHPVLKRIIELREEESDPLEKDEQLKKYPQELVNYYNKKYDYLKNNKVISEKDTVEYVQLAPEHIQKELENMQVITFVVTDKCNLRCRYCAYGDMYGGYDARTDANMGFDIARQVLDYLFNIWQKAQTMSSKRTVTIGFYGGEPLMNFRLIKQIVGYVSQHTFPHIEFTYNMTTNAMLLDKYQDFLQEHKFRLLISLDGTEEDDCHRITATGENSFQYVFKKVKNLQNTYREYFEKYISFNSVIHSRSNVGRIIDFFEREFGKAPMFSELSRENVINPDLFNKMFLNVQATIIKSGRQDFIDKKLMYVSPNITALTAYLHRYTNETFKDYRTMFYGTRKYSLIPTGTCIPFNRKFLITTNGKIMVCEHIDHKFAVGKVDQNGVHLDLGEIANKYNEQYYNRIVHLCNKCYAQGTCSQCIFQTDIDKTPVRCKNFNTYSDFARHLAANLTYLEQNRWAYKRVMEEITLF